MFFDYKPIHESAKKPKRATRDSIGYDVYSPVSFCLCPGQRKTIGLGFSSRFSDGHVALLWDKSGLASKKGITVLAGVIDPQFLDEWGVVLLNTSEETVHFEVGDKLTQIVFVKAEFPEGLEADDKERTGGWGSTGQ